MTAHEQAPRFGAGERPEEYLRRVIDYLAEPHRRRLGLETATEMLSAVDQLADDGVDSAAPHRAQLEWNREQGVRETLCPNCSILFPEGTGCPSCG